MVTAKDIIVKPIGATDARAFIKGHHYSGKVVNNSKLHLGVFLGARLEGVMQFGPPINKKGTLNIVKGTNWSGMMELNRLAFTDRLPKNSESRALGIAMRLIKKNYPHIKWIVSFADATQCGDGTIYRASGFYLTDIRVSDALRTNPATGETMHVIQAHHKLLAREFRSWKALEGFQLRYIYFIDKSYKDRLTVPIIPFSAIKEAGASMYKGAKPSV